MSSHTKTAILIKSSYLNDKEIKENYLDKIGITAKSHSLYYDINNKVTAKQAKEYLKKLLPHLVQDGITTMYVPDATYFKVLTGQKKAEPNIGYVLNCALKGYEHLTVIYGVNYAQLLYNPNAYTSLDLSLQTLKSHLEGTYKTIGNIIHSASYNSDDLNKLLHEPMLACDIETTGLELGSELISIGFAKDKHNGICFKVTDKKLLKTFFERYQGYKIFHNASFDIKHIIYHCFMKDPNDMRGMLHGLHTMYRNLHDTKIIAYLATNNTQGNTLGLKDLGHEFVGNYAVDFNKVSDDELLEYNLKDCLTTFYVFDKYYPRLLQDNQREIYETIMLPSLKVITEMELIGMPIDLKQVTNAETELLNIAKVHNDTILNNPYFNLATKRVKEIELERINKKLKTKQHSLDKVADYKFNPYSNQHLQVLLYEVCHLPIIDLTDTKQPATGAKTLDKLLNHATDEEIKQLLSALIGLSKVSKILSAFIPAFKKAKPRANFHFLHGNFNLGGTVSGRLSSSNPNLQQIPSGSTYGKIIKTCFKAPKGFIMVGADYNALEDRINALLTKDPNKLKVFTDGFDGHSLRAYYYWRDKFPDIVETPESINSIQTKYKELRNKSKAPSFALQYKGSPVTLMNNCGFTEQEANAIYENYHKMYEVSGKWVDDKIALCTEQGYIDVAFGLRIRTPILAKTILNTNKTPKQAQAEARSVGNAVSGQSYGLLTNRAINEFMERVWNSEYKYDIFPISLIHDAIYLMIRNNVNVVKWTNDNLIDCMRWQNLAEIQHNEVHLEAELDLYYPSWANAITLPNKINRNQIKEIVKNSKK